MSSAPSHKLMTAEDLRARSSGLERCELIEGELIQMSPAGGNHGRIGFELARQIGNFVVQRKLGKVYMAETGFILHRNPDTVRAPDIAFIATDRLEQANTSGFIPIPPDLAIEVTSPSDAMSDVVAKVRWWLEHGTHAVWVVDPRSQTVTTYHPDGSARVYSDDQTLQGNPTLPGFTLPLDQLFTDIAAK